MLGPNPKLNCANSADKEVGEFEVLMNVHRVLSLLGLAVSDSEFISAPGGSQGGNCRVVVKALARETLKAQLLTYKVSEARTQICGFLFC